jgi:S1-C subfamily serine protease
MPSAERIFQWACVVASVLLLAGGPGSAAEPLADPARRLEAVVGVHAEIPAEARTASLLGTKRDGSGVVIDDAGLIVTIGYLITEAMAVEVTTAAGKASRAEVIGFDTESGLGLLRAAEPLNVRPMPIGTAKGLAEKTPVILAGHGGAALIAPDGKLAGIGSLIVAEADGGFPGNMFVPIDRLQPVMGDLIALGRPSSSRPWLGANLQDLNGELVVRRVAPEGPAEAAGLRHGDHVIGIDGSAVHDLAALYRALWARGEAGITVTLTVTRHGEQQQIGVKTIDRYRYLKLGTTY